MFKCSRELGLAALVIGSNIWLYTDSCGRRFLIDSGLAFERAALRYHLWKAGVRRRGDLTALLLTHRHSDHAQNAAWVRREFDCPVLCHENDAAYLCGNMPVDPMPLGRGNFIDDTCARYENRFFVQMNVDDTFSSGPWKYDFVVVPVFGHTEGSVMLYHEKSRILFSGDAILAGIPPFRQIEQLSPARMEYSCDIKSCWCSTLEFVASAPPVLHLASGHGPYVGQDVMRKLGRFHIENSSRLFQVKDSIEK